MHHPEVLLVQRMFALAFVSLVAVSAFAQNTLFEQGKLAMGRQDYDAAADLFAKAVAQSPKNADYHYWLGNAYGSLAEHANIFKQASLASKTHGEYETAVKLDPNNLDARMGLIQYFMLAPGIMGGSETKAIEQANEIMGGTASGAIARSPGSTRSKFWIE